VRIKRLEKQKKDLEKIVSVRTHEILEKNHELEKQKNLIEHKSDILLQQKNEIEAQAKALELQKEELKELVASKDRIFSIISHDLRAPLGNIKNMIDILTENPDRFDAKKRNVIFQNFSSIIRSTFYLIDNLLNWTRSQRGLIVYDPQIFLVAPVIDDVLGLFKPVYEKKEIEINIAIDDSTIAFGDVNMVNTIFRNLISNAVKFTPNNGKIEISSTINDDKIVFSIKDNGIGMSEENLKNFLENKEMTTTYGTDNEKGSGLGLLLCRDFIAKNGGDFYVESQEGKGTAFFFTLKRFQV
jgi:signal transduction histidine kinase